MIFDSGAFITVSLGIRSYFDILPYDPLSFFKGAFFQCAAHGPGDYSDDYIADQKQNKS